MRTDIRMKICGVTGPQDAEMAVQAGADFVGVLVEVDVSPRSVSLGDASRIASEVEGVVALTYDAPIELDTVVVAAMKPAALQLAGSESIDLAGEVTRAVPCAVWKSIHLRHGDLGSSQIEGTLAKIARYVAAGISTVVLDTAVPGSRGGRLGGTGVTHDWRAAGQIVAASSVPVFLAGGGQEGSARSWLKQGRQAHQGRDVAWCATGGTKGARQPSGVRPADTRCQWPVVGSDAEA